MRRAHFQLHGSFWVLGFLDPQSGTPVWANQLRSVSMHVAAPVRGFGRRFIAKSVESAEFGGAVG